MFPAGCGICPPPKTEYFSYDLNGLLTTFRKGSGSDDLFDLDYDWRYRYGPGSERESKREYASPLGDESGNAHLWTYYALSGTRQLAVYKGLQSLDADCHPQKVVWLFPDGVFGDYRALSFCHNMLHLPKRQVHNTAFVRTACG